MREILNEGDRGRCYERAKQRNGGRARERKKIDVYIRHTFKKTIFLILIRMTISINKQTDKRTLPNIT